MSMLTGQSDEGHDTDLLVGVYVLWEHSGSGGWSEKAMEGSGA